MKLVFAQMVIVLIISGFSAPQQATAKVLQICRVTSDQYDEPVVAIVAFRQKFDPDYVPSGYSTKGWITRTVKFDLGNQCQPLYVNNWSQKFVDTSQVYWNFQKFLPPNGVSKSDYESGFAARIGYPNKFSGDGKTLHSASYVQELFDPQASWPKVTLCYIMPLFQDEGFFGMSLMHSDRAGCNGSFYVDDTRPFDRKYCGEDIKCGSITLLHEDVEAKGSPVSQASIEVYDSSENLSGEELKRMKELEISSVPDITFEPQEDRKSYWITDATIRGF